MSRSSQSSTPSPYSADTVRLPLVRMDTEKRAPPPPVQKISDLVGDFGPWQARVFGFFFFGAIFSAFHSLGLTFFAPSVDYWCEPPEKYKNITTKEWLSINNDTLRCKKLDNLNEECNKWEYDTSFYKSTLINEFDLTCSRAWLASASQSCYMFGSMFAVFVGGQISDRFGRLPMVWIGLVLEIGAGISCASSISIYQYLASRFVLAVGASCRWGAGFVLILEIIAPKYRSHCGIGFQYGWACGYIILPAIAYYVRDFRTLQLVCILPEVVLFLFWWLIPESPRWLLIQRNLTKAKYYVKKAALMNKRPDVNINEDIKSLMETLAKETQSSNRNSKATFLDLWTYPRLRRHTVMLYFTWFVNSFIYYGISLNTNSLGADPYISFFLAGLVEFPAYLLSAYGLEHFGRRKLLLWAMMGGGLSCLATIPFSLNDDYVWLRVAFATIGKFCVASSYSIIYVYSAEIYPTVVRQVGVGSSSMVARVGSIMAPFVKELGNYTHVTVALAIFGILSIVDGLVVAYLPETKGKELPDTFEDAERLSDVGSVEFEELRPSNRE